MEEKDIDYLDEDVRLMTDLSDLSGLADQRQMRYYYDLIRSKLGESSRPYHQEIFRTIIRAVLFEILSLIERQSPAEEERPDAEVNRIPAIAPTRHLSQYHFKNFLDLLSKTQVKHQTVSYYASRLRSALPLRLSKNLTAKYLSVICKENSQKSPLDWIRDMTNEDIRHHLLATDLSIKEIANNLGFERSTSGRLLPKGRKNASFFGKYVKKHFGCSPMEYRISHTNKK